MLVEGGDTSEVEIVEEQAVALATMEDGAPGEAGLGALQTDEFEQVAVVVRGDAPLAVVVFAHEGSSSEPKQRMGSSGDTVPFCGEPAKPGGGGRVMIGDGHSADDVRKNRTHRVRGGLDM